jgi:phage terminase large subunit-like protein
VLGSYGEGAAEWLRDVYGMELRGWQRHALDRALEYDHEGDLVWPTVIITVGRQSGKSYLARAVCMWRLHHADLFGETQTIMHVANKRSTAMEVLRPAGLWAVERYGKKAARWGNENAGIELPSGDRWLVHAANDSAGVGYSVSMLFVDEAWKIKEEVVTASLAPTMAERAQGQMWLVSTAGDSTSDLMIGYRQRALDRLEADDPGSILLLEWSAPAEADPENEETWKFGSPEWSTKRRDFLAQQWNNVEESAFRQQYLNQWIVRANHWMKETWWKETLDADVDLPAAATWSVAVESDFDGMGHAVAIAAPLDDGTIVVRATTHRTIREVDERLAQIRKEHPSIFVQVTPGYVDRLRERFDTLVGQREAAAATQNLLDLFDRRAIRHDGSQVLQEHFAASTISRRQGGWVLTAPMGKGGVYAARAALFAMAQACKTPKPLAMIRSSKRRHA